MSRRTSTERTTNRLATAGAIVAALLVGLPFSLVPQSLFSQDAAVSSQRLAELDPSAPEQYKRYAEELAEKGRNPAARAASLRLFHIAAWLDPQRLGRGSLQSMIALARTPEEAQRFQAALYLLDPAADASLLSRPLIHKPSAGSRSPPPDLLQGIRAIRQGRRDVARGYFRSAVVREFVAGDEHRALRDELQQLLAATPLTDEQLSRLVALELQWTASPEVAETPTIAPGNWSDDIATTGLAPVRGVTLLHLTEFDPRLSVFRNGKWVAP